MYKNFTLVLATLAMSAAAFAQTYEDGPYQIGYAAHLNYAVTHGLPSGAILNLSNDGALAGFYQTAPTNAGAGNICANVYVMDAQEEELACCSCLITPNGLASLSTNQLIGNLLTPATVDSIVIKLVASVPGTASGGAPTVCNAGAVVTTAPSPGVGTGPGDLTYGLLAWGITLEPTIAGNTYAPVTVPFFQGTLNTPAGALPELTSLVNVCNFIRGDGTGFGLCTAACQYPGGTNVGALSGARQ